MEIKLAFFAVAVFSRRFRRKSKTLSVASISSPVGLISPFYGEKMEQILYIP